MPCSVLVVNLTAFALFRRAGAGFASQGAYLHGLFSARIKLPADHTAGVVVAFYVSTLFLNKPRRCGRPPASERRVIL